MSRWLRDPLLHFLAIGALLFAAYSWLGSGSGTAAGDVVVGAAEIEALAAGWQRKWRRPPTTAELERLVEEEVRRELLYREALALGLDRDDDVVRRRLIQEGVDILEGITVVGASGGGGDLRISFKRPDAGPGGEGMVTGTHILVAAGRRPNTGGLDLEKAGVEHTPGGITVDARLRTTNRKIFAIGDVAGGPQFTHVAGYHAGVVIKNALFRMPAKADHSAVPWVTYTDPELAQVGLTEAMALEKGMEINVLRWPFGDNDRAVAEADRDGMVKVVSDRRGRILGCGIAGRHAGELIQPWVLALGLKRNIGVMAGMIAPYPTRGEASKRAAGSFYAPKLFTTRVRWLVRFLALFG